MPRLLLIHTGGTIGMAPGPNGLAPVKGLVESALSARLTDDITLVANVFNPLLDSASVGPTHWNAMLEAIRAHPGVPTIITHGTDTMSFTGAALSQALVGEGRRVILCGSMVPLGENGDAEGNLSLAIEASQQEGEGVFLAFAGQLLRAEGLVKHHSHDPISFRALPQAPLPQPKSRTFDERKFAILTLSPGIAADTLAAALATLDGAVLRVFGAGTVMACPVVLKAFEDAVKAGKRIRAVSQCEGGGIIPGSYEAGAGLWEAGVENGGDDTPEAALIKLWLN
ncbi:asparaginase domain-containing protein [Rhizobium helianthi]|uniref:Asparaginase domain-containing protein n=1 Tax=Rhizobium helianthi TaxID=1132695 RepID=A0ABW4M4T3_9HYPH